MAWQTRAQQLKEKYSITEEIYEQMLKAQGGVCAICRCHQRYKRLAVDHDHKTSQVRGLLCESCNRGLGRFFDSEYRLQSAINYLRNAKRAWNEVMNGHSSGSHKKDEVNQSTGVAKAQP